MRILIADTAYPEFLKTVPVGSGTYDEELAKFLSKQFGTFYAYSKNLTALGHECIDVIVNHDELQSKWAEENYSGQGRRNELILDLQIEKFKPDVVFLQDLSVKVSNGDYLIAAQCSCAFDPVSVTQCNVIFSSLPMHVRLIDSLGVKSVFLPLAFESSVLEGPNPERDIDISFVGGAGRNSHWRSGTDTLEAVAAAFTDRFQWYGYGLDNLPAGSALRSCYRGEAWGGEMYGIYRRSKIVVNRHGEVAEGFANNLRLYESTGCGALLVTEAAPNLGDLFGEYSVVTYDTAGEAVYRIRHYLDSPALLNHVAKNGQAETLRRHTYAERMKVVSQTLTEMLCQA